MRTSNGVAWAAAATLVAWSGACAAAPTGAARQKQHADQSQAEREKDLAALLEKQPGSMTAERALVDSVFYQTRGPAAPFGDRVIYGEDDRREVYEYDALDPQLRAMAEACAIVVRPSELVNNGNGTYTLLTDPWVSQGGTICPDEPFRGQPTIGFCSSFLVGPDLITTAGHCVDAGDIGNVAFVFGFQLNDSDETGPTVVPAEWVYFGNAIVNQALSGGNDHSVVRLDRAVTGINPVPVRYTGTVDNGAPLVVIGHPAALLKKIAGGAEVKSNTPAGFFQANLDTYGGNSGSMVINLNTYTVEGILVRGAPDYVTVGGCVRSNEVPDTGNTGGGLLFEEVSKTTTFASFIPPLGLQVNPSGAIGHLGLVGGPFTNNSTVHALSNPTGNPLDYAISVSGDAILDLSGALSGQIAGGGSASVTAALSASTAGLARGNYAATITFEDLTNARTTTVTHNLEIGQTLIDVTGADLAGGGPVGGPFPLSGSYTVTSLRPTPVDVLVSSDAAWISVDGGSSATVSLAGDGASDTVDVTINSAAGTLAAGIYNGTVTFENLDNGSTETFTVTLDVGRFAFVSSGPAQPIGDNQTITSSLSVPVSFCIGDVDVSVNMSHTFQGDLIVELLSPEGTVVRLHNRGGGGDDYVPVTYDDDGSGTAPSGPGTLADFDGQGAAGTWTLRVLDQASGDSGTLSSWTLRPAASGDLCPPVAFAGVASIEENWLGEIDLNGAASNGGALSYVITALPSNGVLWDAAGGSIASVPHVLSGDSVIYRADLGVIGADNFAFKVTETTRDVLDSAPALIAVTVGGAAPLHTFNMDTNPGWTYQGQWAWGQPTGGGGAGSASGPDPTSGFTGANVVGYNLNGDYANNIPELFATTGALAVNGAADLELSFYRWLGMESSTFDDARIQIAVDGGAWQNVWVHDGASFGDDAWIPVSYDLDGLAAGAGSIQLRWGIGPTDSSVVYPGWNIDDVVISGTAAGQRGPIDFTGDGQVDSGDLAAFIQAFIAGEPAADLTGDGQVDSGDLAAFVVEFI